MKNIMKEAHNLTKKIIRKGDSYRATFRICLSFVHSQIKKGVDKMEYKTRRGTSVVVELTGKNVSYLSVNGIVITDKEVEGSYIYVTEFDNTIVLNDSRYYKKLGSKSIAKIEASKELIEASKEAKRIVIAQERAERERVLGTSTKANLDYSIEKHMNDVNA